MLVRFILDENGLSVDDPREEEDMIWMRTERNLSRVSGPLTKYFRWLEYATTHVVHNSSAFVLKVDDDAYITVPELCLILHAVDRQRDVHPHVYLGHTYWTAYAGSDYAAHGASYTERAVRANLGASPAKDACTALGCTGPFPFATGSLRLTPRPLDRARECACTLPCRLGAHRRCGAYPADA